MGNNRVRKVGTNGIITTIAGNGLAGGPAGDGGPATSAIVQGPTGVVLDAAGNLYISSSNFIRRVDTSGLISTVAGGGNNGLGDGGPATAARLNNPQDVAFDSAGNLYIADTNRVREVDSSGIIATIAGNGQGNYFGDGGPATAAGLDSPVAVVVDKNGNLFIADQTENRIREVNASGIITTIAGNGAAGYSGDGGPATAATLNSPMGLAMDTSGNLYIADTFNQRIRKITRAGIISTIAGTVYGLSGDGGPATQAMLGNPYGVAVDSYGTVYIADRDNNRIRTVTRNGIIQTVAGSGAQLAGGFSGDGGPAISAQLYFPEAVTVDGDDNIYIADTSNWRIRMVSHGTINTIFGAGPHAGDPSPNEAPALGRWLESPQSLVLDRAGNLFVASDESVLRLSTSGLSNYWVNSFLQTEPGLGDNGPAALASLSFPRGIALDPAGNLFIADSGDNRVRKVLGATAAPQIALSTEQLTFTSNGEANPAPQQLLLNNSGAGMLSWSVSISPSATWLTVTPSDGLAPGATALTVNATIAGLTKGTHTGLISFSSPSVPKPKVVNVRLVLN
jgi:sugar lactone lactonase YvrE